MRRSCGLAERLGALDHDPDAPVPFATPRSRETFRILAVYGRFVDDEDAFYWTEEWQAGEREADDDIQSGRMSSFESIDALIEHLDRL